MRHKIASDIVDKKSTRNIEAKNIINDAIARSGTGRPMNSLGSPLGRDALYNHVMIQSFNNNASTELNDVPLVALDPGQYRGAYAIKNKLYKQASEMSEVENDDDMPNPFQAVDDFKRKQSLSNDLGVLRNIAVGTAVGAGAGGLLDKDINSAATGGVLGGIAGSMTGLIPRNKGSKKLYKKMYGDSPVSKRDMDIFKRLPEAYVAEREMNGYIDKQADELADEIIKIASEELENKTSIMLNDAYDIVKHQDKQRMALGGGLAAGALGAGTTYYASGKLGLKNNTARGLLSGAVGLAPAVAGIHQSRKPNPTLERLRESQGPIDPDKQTAEDLAIDTYHGKYAPFYREHYYNK